MGYSMMILHDGAYYRFTAWPKWNGTTLRPIWKSIKAIELYNHSASLPLGTSPFDSYESVNLAYGGVAYDNTSKIPHPLVAPLLLKLKQEFGF